MHAYSHQSSIPCKSTWACSSCCAVLPCSSSAIRSFQNLSVEKTMKVASWSSDSGSPSRLSEWRCWRDCSIGLQRRFGYTRVCLSLSFWVCIGESWLFFLFQWLSRQGLTSWFGCHRRPDSLRGKTKSNREICRSRIGSGRCRWTGLPLQSI